MAEPIIQSHEAGGTGSVFGSSSSRSGLTRKQWEDNYIQNTAVFDINPNLVNLDRRVTGNAIRVSG